MQYDNKLEEVAPASDTIAGALLSLHLRVMPDLLRYPYLLRTLDGRAAAYVRTVGDNWEENGIQLEVWKAPAHASHVVVELPNGTQLQCSETVQHPEHGAVQVFSLPPGNEYPGHWKLRFSRPPTG